MTVEFERPGDHDLADCMRLVMNQMKASPTWPEGPEGTGLLNYVCFDSTLQIVEAKLHG